MLAVEQENPGVPLGKLPLRAIRQRLEANAETGAKVAALVSSRGGDPVLLYGALKLVLAMLSHGVSFTAIDTPPATHKPPL